MSRAEDTSGLDTDVDLDVKRQPKRKHISDESDDDSRSSVFDESSLFRPVAPETLSVSIATQSLSPKGQCTFNKGWHFDMVWQKVFCRDSGKNSKNQKKAWHKLWLQLTMLTEAPLYTQVGIYKLSCVCKGLEMHTISAF